MVLCVNDAMTKNQIPVPPPIAGAPPPSWRDAPMLVRWMITGLRHGSSKSSGARKMLLVVLARVLVVAFWPMAGLFAYRMGCARSRWVYYASRSATQCSVFIARDAAGSWATI